MVFSGVGKTQDELRKDWRKEAIKQVNTMLILHRIARDHHLSISSEEISQSLNETIQAMISRGEADESNVDVEALKASLTVRIINEKALDYLERTYIKRT